MTNQQQVSDAMIEAGVERAESFGWEHFGADDAREIYLAMHQAKPEQQSDVVEALRDEVIAAYKQGALDVHKEWAAGYDNDRRLLARQDNPDFTEAAHDYADSRSAIRIFDGEAR